MAPPSDDRQRINKKGAASMDPGYATGYETDSVPPSLGGKKSGKTRLKKKKSKAAVAADAGYETDDGYVSSGTTKGKKSRLFRLGNRSKTNLQAEEPPPPPPLPELPAPVFRLPIAARFATTLGDFNANATAEPPLPAPLQPSSSAVVALRDVSSPAPTLDSVFIRDADRDSLDVPESTTAHSVDHIQTQVFNSTSAARRRGHINFTSSDSSDNHGSTSTGHSFFSKWTTTSSASSSSSPQSKHPPISYPLTRSPSPPSPTTTTTVVVQKSNLKRVPESLTIDSSLTVPDSASRNPSPGGWSPFVVVTPNPPGTPERSASPVPNNVRPPFLARNFNPPSPQVATRTHLTVDVNPSADYSVPSPSPRARSPAFPLSPSQIIAQRDLPPPSPPPTQSLPQAWDDDDQQPVEEMHDVMARFKRASDESSGSDELLRVALERNQSSEALDEMSQYPDEEKSMGRETMYRYEHGAQSTGNLSTWSSGDRDGRTSIMDIEKSEVARERFVQRIDEMFDRDGRERLAAPPVPRLPQAYAKPVRF
ncbi:hypothetical protein CPB85DRAFT_1024733 [Mucidula mucida]|nr:hypothetical protein CPB85DRAFT_1024733 [Mucidula mucida]